MIIINERKYVEDILHTNIKPETVGVKRLLLYIAKYHYSDWKDLSVSQYSKNVLQRIKDFHLSPAYYQEYKYANYVKNICTKLKKEKIPTQLRDIKNVIISKPEMNLIQSAQNEKEQKVLFTLYVLAKINHNSNGWVNYSTADIFKAANVVMKKWDRESMIGNMGREGLLSYSRSTKNSAIKVDFIEGEPEVEISSFEKIGNQYIVLYKPGWIMCRKCGRLIKKHGNNQKYCYKCSDEIEAEKQAEYNRVQYKKFKDFEKTRNPA